MSESHLAQLRFDILEKVQIHPQQAGIGSLLELDLFPDVKIEDQETHLRIHGFLRLNGTYEGDDAFPPEKAEQSGEDKEGLTGEKIEEIAYVIPVEITLPVERADQERITAEVEAFDYKVLSPFELQIEAVLVIDGLLPEKTVEEDGEFEEEAIVEPKEEVLPTFSTYPEMKKQEDPESLQEDEVQDDTELEEDVRVFDHQFFHIASRSEEESQEDEVDSFDLQEEERKQEVAHKKEIPLREPDLYEFQPVQESSSVSFSEKDLTEHKVESETEPQAALPSEKDNLFSLNPRQHSNKYEEDFSFGQHLRPLSDTELINETEEKLDKSAPKAPQQEEVSLEEQSSAKEMREEKVSSVEGEEEAEHPENIQEETSSLEWTRWLVSEEKANPFVRMKMVIAQRDESLAGIAERYEVSLSELQSLNALDSEVLEEGQIIYIPHKPE